MGSPNALLRITKRLTKLLGMAFGFGLTGNISDAYIFLMNVYQPGDRVFVFGFSRGSYTARALCGMLRMFGLIAEGNDGQVAYAARMFRFGPRRGRAADAASRRHFAIAEKFKETFSQPCKPYFVGLWDTVSSVGWITDPVNLPYTTNNPDIQIARHAISSDERRCFYRQNLLGAAGAGQDIKQVWFAGVHSDVGGSYPEPEEGGTLAQIALEKMLGEATAAGLLVDSQKVGIVLGKPQADPGATLHKSLKGAWRLFEILPHRYKKKLVGPQGTRWVTRWRIHPGMRRQIPAGSLIHHSVIARRELPIGYSPSNLPQDFTVV